VRLQAALEFGAVTTACLPLRVEKRQMRVERALSRTEHIRALASHDQAHQLAAAARSTDDFPDRCAVGRQFRDNGVRFLAAKVALVLETFGTGEGSGSTTVAPRAVRIGFIDFDAALRKVLLAFSIRCQRSATWIASGSARAAASP